MIVYRFVLHLNDLGTPTEIYPENFVKIRLDLTEILRISKLDWRAGGGEGKEKGRRGGILLCNGLMCIYFWLSLLIFEI